MATIIKLVVFLVNLLAVYCIEEGDTCGFQRNGEQLVGTCKPLLSCPYVINIVDVEEKDPPICKWNGKKPVVCCPTEESLKGTGVLREYFSSTKDGVLANDELTCRYDGQVPMLCCPKVEIKPNPEPTLCPNLTLPSGPRDFAWTKCLEYQRYIQFCESTEEDPDTYQRKVTCAMSEHKTNAILATRIVGGTEVQRREVPCAALLGVRNVVNPEAAHIQWVGGGTLISDKFVLTAGHLKMHRDHGRVSYVLLGVTNITEAKDDGLLFNVINWVKHDKYEDGIKNYDIALAELDRRVQFSHFVYPACLPGPGHGDEFQEFIVAGWGVTDNNRPSEVLLKAHVAIEKTQDRCRVLNRASFEWDSESMICAKESTEDSCQGDSGGPLLARSNRLTCTYVVVGVVSWGPGCGKSPSVYTKVSHYLNWIVDHTWLK